jgi:D-ribulokinase
VGGEALVKLFGGRIRELDEMAASYIPTSLLVYPLVKKGERMPFVSDQVEGFVVGEPRDEFEHFAGYLEGIALVAAWSIEAAGELGAPVDGEFFIAGGGAHGKNLGRVLASVLGKPLIVSHEPEGAMGGAILSAASAWHGGSVSAAQAAMVQRAEVLEPVPAWIEPLKQKLKELKAECRSRGFI